MTGLMAIFLTALALSAIACYELSGWSGFFISMIPGTDMETYLANAHGILDGSWPPPEPYYRAPLYPYFLALLLQFCDSLTQLALAQCVLYALSILLIAIIVAIELGMVWAGIAGILMIGYGGAMYLTSITHSAMVELLLSSLLLFAVAIWRRLLPGTNQQSTLNPAYIGSQNQFCRMANYLSVWSMLCGLSFALLCLVRPNFLLIAPFFLLGFWCDWRSGKLNGRVIVMQITIMALSASVILGITIMRNNQFSDRFVLLSTNGAATYVIANSADSTVFNFVYPKDRLLHPNEWAFWKHQLRKAIGYWWSCEVPQNDNYYLFRENSSILQLLRLPFALFGALTIIGSIALIRRLRRYWPYYAFFWIYYLSIVAFFILGRFRLPGLPAMMVLGMGGLAVLWEVYRQQHYGRFGAGILGLTLLFILMRPFSSEIRPNDYFNVAYCSLFFNDPAEALNALQKLAQDKNHPFTRDAAVYEAIALTMQNKYPQALAAIAAISQQYPDDKDIIKARVSLLEFTGQHDQAAALRASGFKHNEYDSCRDLISEGIMYFHQQQQMQIRKLWKLIH